MIRVQIQSKKAQPTKRGVLGKIAKIYDPLGFVSPTTLQDKFFCRDYCDLKLSWDAKLPNKLQERWKTWENNLPDHVEAPRSLAKYHEPIDEIELHAFGDASGQGVAVPSWP